MNFISNKNQSYVSYIMEIFFLAETNWRDNVAYRLDT